MRGAARRQVDERHSLRHRQLPPPDRCGLAAVERDHPQVGQRRDKLRKIVRLDLANVAVAARPPPGAADHVPQADASAGERVERPDENTSELQSLMRSSYAGLCWKKKT